MVITVLKDSDTFDKMSVGDVFKYNDCYYIKTTNYTWRYESTSWNAFNISDNTVAGFEENVKVQPVEYEFTIKEH